MLLSLAAVDAVVDVSLVVDGRRSDRAGSRCVGAALVLCAAVLGASPWLTGASGPPPPVPSQAVPVVFTGDSHTAGVGATTPANNYVNRLLAMLRGQYGGAATALAVWSESASFGTPATGSGLHGYNAGQGSTQASDFLTEAERTSVANLDPAAIFVNIGQNDYGLYGVSAASYTASLATVLDDLTVKAPDAVQVLVLNYERSTSSAATWAQYRTALQELAAVDPARRHFVDVSGAFGTAGTGSDPHDLVRDDDYPHLTDAGHLLLAQTIYGALSGRVP